MLGTIHALQCVFLFSLIVVGARAGMRLLLHAQLDIEQLEARMRQLPTTDRGAVLERLLEGPAAETFPGAAMCLAREGLHVSGDPQQAAMATLSEDPAWVWLPGMGRVGTLLGVLGTVLSLLWWLNGDHGLLALQAGRVQEVASGSALLSISLGIGTGVVAQKTRRTLFERRSRTKSDIRKALTLLRSITEETESCVEELG